MAKPRLISFTVCPYVQRAALALEEKGVDYEIEFIDLSDKPQWFLDISPRGKVPVLLDGGIPLFESQAIVEYIDETQAGVRLAPGDARLRARDRAWFTYASEEILPASWKMESAADQGAFDEALAAMQQKLRLIDEALAGRTFLSGGGKRFGLADVAFVPALYRLAAWQLLTGREDFLEGLHHVAGWSERLLARESVSRSVPRSWSVDAHALGKRLGSYLSTLAS